MSFDNIFKMTKNATQIIVQRHVYHGMLILIML